VLWVDLVCHGVQVKGEGVGFRVWERSENLFSVRKDLPFGALWLGVGV